MSYGPEIRLKMLRIHRVEAHDSRVGKEIEFGDLAAEDIRTAVCVNEGFEGVEGGEEGDDVVFVGGLGRGETSFVDAVAYEVCEPGFYLVNLVLELRGVVVQGFYNRRWWRC